MRKSAKEMVQHLSTLATLPDICMRISEAASDPNSSAFDMGKIIGQDPALTAQVLKVANSSFYSANAKIDTLTRAVVMLGLQQLRYLTFSVCSIDVVAKFKLPAKELEHFWKHSFYTGICARLLASKLHIMNTERLFVMGLLHDIGKLVFQHSAPEHYRRAATGASRERMPQYRWEKGTFGFDHAELGAELLTSWRLPSALCDAVRFHHDPERAGTARMEAALVHLGDAVAWRLQGSTESTFAPEIHPSAWTITGLNERIFDAVGVLAEKQYEEVSVLYKGIASEANLRRFGGAA
ncbi:MAG: HDOD domain-containing protein [Gammaproteobacteria bacterium]|nr:HDOD domain-containing protein [Gammaproteobacteria bacterium]